MDREWAEIDGKITPTNIHIFPVKVYYEDTDFSGVVYHSNYLKYCERGRSSFLKKLGISHKDLFFDGDKYYFVIKSMNIEFIAPATIDDLLEVRTKFIKVSGAKIFIKQDIYLGSKGSNNKLFNAKLTIAMLSGNGKIMRIPKKIRDVISVTEQA